LNKQYKNLKIMKNILGLLFAVLFMFLLTTSCGSSVSKMKDSAKSTIATGIKKGKEYTSKYVCPDHCEGSGSDKAGKCPVCGMDYVENKQ
jgi:hypothetical protein